MSVELEGPFELLDLRDRQSLVLTVLDYKLGITTIHPRYPGGPLEKQIRVLRVHVPREEKAAGVAYWDLTSQTLIAQLLPFLPDLKARKGKVRIQAFGMAPSKRFSVELLP